VVASSPERSKAGGPVLELATDLQVPRPDTPPVQTWPDAAGRGRVRAFRVGDSCWLEWPGVAWFAITPGSPTTRAVPWPGADGGVVANAFHRFVMPLAWQAGGGEALHASALSRNGVAAIAFLASSGTGKSTIACGLALRGYIVLTDDGLLVDAGMPARVRAVTTEVRLRPESSAHFGFPVPSERHTLDPGTFKSVSAATLGGVVLLERAVQGTRAVASRLAGGEALAAVLAHAHCLDPTDDARRARSVARYLEIVAEVPVWRLTYASGFDTLDTALDLVEQLAEGAW
jgi:hypothetical protein